MSPLGLQDIGIYLTKEVKNAYNEDIKTLKKESEEDTRSVVRNMGVAAPLGIAYQIVSL